MTRRRDRLSYALSQEAHDYLREVFGCTTRSHLMLLGKPASDTKLNTFEEHLKLRRPMDEVHIDEEISKYLKAVKEGHEPHDPADHDFEIKQASTEGYWDVYYCGEATGGETDLLCTIHMKEKPTKPDCYNLFNENAKKPDDE